MYTEQGLRYKGLAGGKTVARVIPGCNVNSPTINDCVKPVTMATCRMRRDRMRQPEAGRQKTYERADPLSTEP